MHTNRSIFFLENHSSDNYHISHLKSSPKSKPGSESVKVLRIKCDNHTMWLLSYSMSFSVLLKYGKIYKVLTVVQIIPFTTGDVSEQEESARERALCQLTECF